MNDILMISHFHKDFPFNHNSSWMRAAYAGGTGAYEYYPPSKEGVWINTSREPKRIQEYQHHYSGVSELEFLKAMGQQPSEYWLWKYGKADFIGCTTYRRYLLLDDITQPVSKIVMAANQASADYLSSDRMKNAALHMLETHDVITNIETQLPCTIEEQYLQSQPREYWDLFLRAITELLPDYRNNLDWFTKGRTASFETCYIMRKQLFKKYVSELFEIYEYIWTYSKTAYPTQQTTSEPLPWRYPGFLGERFLPFFIAMNACRPIHVPLVILE